MGLTSEFRDARPEITSASLGPVRLHGYPVMPELASSNGTILGLAQHIGLYVCLAMFEPALAVVPSPEQVGVGKRLQRNGRFLKII